jgi:neopullulanase
MTFPSWLQNALFYQIFPERFAKGEPSIQLANLQPWGAPPTHSGFQGGNLNGILQKMDYLQELGINAIYLNPIFLSPSNHRYNTSDYFSIDPRLGNLSDFQAFIQAAHTRGMRVVLDGVFNHCSRGFFPFVDILENGPESGYLDWFHIQKFPLQAYTPGKAQNYLGWWGYKSLPKLNTDNPGVRRYIFDVARYWIDQGADGWRLDVPNEIDDDQFWAEFRQIVKTANPEACLIGELWETAPRWVNETHFDSLMNYPLRAGILGLLMRPGIPHSGPAIQPISINQFAVRVEELIHIYPPSHAYGMYNLLGSHDTERIFTLLEGDIEKIKLAFAFLYAYPGAPAMYYGDEIGLTGGRDPDCRKAFPWEEHAWNLAFHSYSKRLIHLRKSIPALRYGDYHRIVLNEENRCYAFARRFDQDYVLIILNLSDQMRKFDIPGDNLGWLDQSMIHDILSNHPVQHYEGKLQLQLPPWGVSWITQSQD